MELINLAGNLPKGSLIKKIYILKIYLALICEKYYIREVSKNYFDIP
jgi:hypothetical protein